MICSVARWKSIYAQNDPFKNKLFFLSVKQFDFFNDLGVIRPLIPFKSLKITPHIYS